MKCIICNEETRFNYCDNCQLLVNVLIYGSKIRQDVFNRIIDKINNRGVKNAKIISA